MSGRRRQPSRFVTRFGAAEVNPALLDGAPIVSLRITLASPQGPAPYVFDFAPDAADELARQVLACAAVARSHGEALLLAAAEPEGSA